MKRLAAVTIALLGVATTACAQELETPRSWTRTVEPGMLAFEPERAGAGQRLRVEIHDPVPGEGELVTWLGEHLARGAVDATVAGRCRPAQRRPTEASCVVNGPGADHFLYGLRLPDGQYRFVYVLSAPNTLASLRHMGTLKRLLDGAEAGHGRGAEAVAGAPAAAPTAGAAPPPHASGTPSPEARAPGAWIRERLESVVLNLEYRAGVGGAVYPEYVPYLLFRDGTLTGDLGMIPADEAALQRWRQQRPRSWGRWNRSGKTIAVQWDDAGRSPSSWENWHPARAGARGARLSGRYRAIGGGGNTSLGGDVMIAAWSSYEFSPDGTVRTAGGSAASSGGGGSGVAVTARSDREARTGRYTIEGHFIALEVDGRTEWHWFYLYPDSENAIGIGGGTFSRAR